MKKYSSIALVIIAAICIGFFLYRANLPRRTNPGNNSSQNKNANSISIKESNISDVISDIPVQQRDNEKVLFVRPASNKTVKVYTIGIDGRNLKELITLDKSSFSNNVIFGNNFNIIAYGRMVITDQATINNIENNLDKFKNLLLNYPMFTFSKNFCVYSMLIEESDISKSAGEKGLRGNAICSKGVFLTNMKTNKTVRLDKDLINQLPDTSFSKDGSLFVNSFSFSHDGRYLFVTFYPNDDLLVFSMEQMKFTGTFHMDVHHVWQIDKVQNNLYFLAGTDSSNIFQFNMDKKELKPLTDCQESTFAISPDSKKLVFTESHIDGKNDLCILNLSNGTLKRIDYPKGGEIAGFVLDSNHLIIKRYYQLSDTDIHYHMAMYLLNLNSLKEAKIYAETPYLLN